MAILSGRNGEVSYDSTGGGTTFTPIISLNTWKLSMKTNKEDVTCYGDTNKVYVPGMMDTQGTIGGFWNSSDLALWTATVATTPGMLKLTPNKTEATHFWKGLAYLDADIDCTLNAPKVTGTWAAAGPWAIPV